MEMTIASKCWEIFMDKPTEVLIFGYMLVQSYTQPKYQAAALLMPSYSSSKLGLHQELKASEFARQCTGWIKRAKIICLEHGGIPCLVTDNS